MAYQTPNDAPLSNMEEKITSIAYSGVSTPALIGICLGSSALLITISIFAWYLYKKKTSQTANKLASAIKKTLPEKQFTGLKKNVSVKSTSSSTSGTKKSPTGSAPTKKSPDKPHGERGSFSKASTSKNESTHIKTEYYVENEKDKSPSTPTKDENEKEKLGEQLKLTKLGSLHFKVRYNFEKNALMVTILRASDLPVKDPNVGSSDPYVKLQLLPDKQHRVKTRVLRKTLNPVYDEEFTFYGLNYNQLQCITLHFVVLSFDRYSRDDVIGEVVCPLSSVDLSNSEKEVLLEKEISPRHLKIRSQGRGELLVSLCYQPAANRLTVVVLKARNLPKMDITGLSDPYVKIYLLYDNQRIAKKKTHVKKRTLNPVFNESFVFDVPCNEGLQNISLEFLVLDWDRVTKNEVIGRLELGAHTSGTALHHWNEVCNSPRRQIAEWHKLKD